VQLTSVVPNRLVPNYDSILPFGVLNAPQSGHFKNDRMAENEERAQPFGIGSKQVTMARGDLAMKTQ
jgi:hypothetical protein